MNRSPLYSLQHKLGAKFVPFAGWEMPVQFSGIVAEHKATRQAAGLFDISHMGQLWVEGAGARDFLQKMTTNDVDKATPGRGIYSLLLNEQGGIIDDLFIFCLDTGRYFLIVNAARREQDCRWLVRHQPEDLSIEEPPQAAAVAFQGPQAAEIMQRICPETDSLPRHGIAEVQIPHAGYALVSRTGYTGEDGFEIAAPAGHVLRLCEMILEIGKNEGVLPCGLGARDTLRLEMGYRLNGQDMNEDRTPLEADLEWVVKLNKGEFIGRDALLQQKEAGVSEKIAGFVLEERGIPRHGAKIFDDDGQIGEVASGSFSPSLEKGIGMGYMRHPPPRTIFLEIHGRKIPARVTKPPFLIKEKKPTAVS